MRFIFTLFILCTFLQIKAQLGPDMLRTGRTDALGGADMGLQDIHALFGNPAGIAWLESWQATAGVRSRFSMKELSTVGAAFAAPLDQYGSFGLMAAYTGYETYNESKVGLAYARRLLPKLSLGLMIDYYGFRIPEYGSRHVFTFELGTQAELLPGLMLGAWVFSPLPVEVAEADDIRPYFALGGAWTVSNRLSLHFKAAQETEFRPSVHAGIEYLMADVLYLRAGISTNPVENAFGIGFYTGSLRFDLAALFHPSLGLTPALSISYFPER